MIRSVYCHWKDFCDRHRTEIGYGVLLVFVLFGFVRTEQQGDRTDEAVQRIQELRTQRIKDQAATNRLICKRQNVAYDILADILRSTEAGDRRNGSRADFVRERERALRRLTPLDCAALPASPPREFGRRGPPVRDPDRP